MPTSGTTIREPVRAATVQVLTDELDRRRLLRFIQRTFPGYQAGWVHADICRRLERFSQAVVAGESPRLILCLPPRHGKSEITSRRFPVWHLGRHPDHEVIVITHNWRKSFLSR